MFGVTGDLLLPVSRRRPSTTGSPAETEGGKAGEVDGPGPGGEVGGDTVSSPGPGFPSAHTRRTR